MDENKEQIAPESVEETTSFNPAEFSEVDSMLKTLKEMCDACRQQVEDNVKTFYHLDPEIIDVNGGILAYTKTDINAMSKDDIILVLDKYGSSENTAFLINESPRGENETDEDVVRRILHELKDMQISLIENERTYAEGVKQAADIANQYQEYLSSDIYKEKRDKYLAQLREAAAAETDESKKREMYKKISIYEDTLTLDFLTDRIRNESIGQKEIKSIVSGFFSTIKGSLVIDKYNAKIEKFGYTKEIYKKFFNLEEMFLPEEYHVYNNLFLYIYMRFVSYANPYEEKDKAYVKSITTNLVSLLYHRFGNGSLEEEFKSLIMSVLDYFKDYRDKFDKENTTHPNHPYAVAARVQREKARKAVIIEKFKQLNITDYDENAKADDLYKLLQDRIDEMKSEQAPIHNGETVDVEHDEDGAVTIEPKTVSELKCEDDEDIVDEPIEENDEGTLQDAINTMFDDARQRGDFDNHEDTSVSDDELPKEEVEKVFNEAKDNGELDNITLTTKSEGNADESGLAPAT